MENLPSILTPDLGLLFWMLLAFLVVFYVLIRFGVGIIIKMVNARKTYIDESLLKAHEATQRLENIKQESEQILQEAREKQSLILKEAAQTRDVMVEKARQVAREESARMLEEAKRQIEVEKQTAIRDIRTQVAELSVQIAEKVMRENLSSNAQQMSLVNRFLDDAFAKSN